MAALASPGWAGKTASQMLMMKLAVACVCVCVCACVRVWVCGWVGVCARARVCL